MSQTIAVLGGEQTFSEIAAEKFFKISKKKCKKIYVETVQDIFHAVKKGSVDLGIVPLENYLYGTVRTTFDALFHHGLYIMETLKIPVHQNCITYASTKKNDIKIIYGHEQALAQSGKYLKSHFPSAKLHSVSSSAEAMMCLNTNPTDSAAIGPIHAKKKGLKILAKDIEDAHENCTVFAVIRKTQKTEKDLRGKKNIHTSLAFYFDKNRPGILYNVLKDFAENNIDLTRIESRPAHKSFGEYIFYIEIKGSEFDKKTQEILAHTKQKVAVLKSFGSFQSC